MISKIRDKVILNKIESLYEDNKNRRESISPLSVIKRVKDFCPEDFKKHYLAISKEQGEFIFDLILKNNLKRIVEFGTSFGISTLFLAAAVKEIGGRIITTELIEEKASIARLNFEDANVARFIDLRVGDAMDTLAESVESIDLLFLDGWKDLYLPLLKLLENKLGEKSYIYVDNADMTGVQPTLQYMSCNNYELETLHGGKAVLAKRRKNEE